MIHVTCSNCNSKIRASEKLAGKNVTCPKCKAKLSIPNNNESDNVSVDADGVYPAQLAVPNHLDHLPSEPAAFSFYPDDIDATIPTAEYIGDTNPLSNVYSHYTKSPVAPADSSKQVSESGRLSKRVLILLLATIIPSTLLLLVGLASLFLFLNTSESDTSDTLQANSQELVPENRGNLTQNQEIEKKRPNTKEEESPSRSTVIAQTPLLRGDIVSPFTPSSTLKWVEYYNKPRLAGEQTYAFLQSENDGDTWMLGRRTTEKNAELTNVENAGFEKGEHFELLSYPRSSDLALEEGPITIHYPDLLLSEYATSDFRIKRLASIGFLRRKTPDPEPSKNRAFAWSEDGKFLY